MTTYNKSPSNAISMPSLLLTNTNRIINKIDELSVLAGSLRPQLIAITETWLSDSIPDSCISLKNYVIFRHDRPERQGGGVLLYVDNCIQCSQLLHLNSTKFEVLWVKLRPKYLPRPYTVLIVSVLYCPPWYSVVNCRELADYIVKTFDIITNLYSRPVFILCGDFNSFNVSLFNCHLHLTQVNSSFTRGNAVLDKVFINCPDLYCADTEILPPLGRSDHNCVYLAPAISGSHSPVGWRSTYKRNFSSANIEAIGSKLATVNWSTLYKMESAQQQADYFYATVYSILDSIAPIHEVRYKNNDKPWVTAYFKTVFKQRQHAYKTGNRALFNKLRNKVNHLRKNLKKQFYFRQMTYFDVSNVSSNWWKVIKTMSGLSKSSLCRTDCSFANVLLYGQSVDQSHLADILNDFFVSCSSHIPCLHPSALDNIRNNLPDVPLELIISEYDVFGALSSVKSNKATGPDGLPNNLIKSIADVFTGPVCAIINTSIRTATVPNQWKVSRVSPIPKTSPPVHIEQDFRPISITSSIAKVAESLLCRHFNDSFSQYLDPNQFGCVKNRSTTLALIKFSHFLFSSLDDRDTFCRILFVDFKKAFDLIDHNILLNKMTDIKLPAHLTGWFLSFLTDRSQFICFNSTSSSIKYVNAGTPQGTLSGSLNFNLTINDLKFLTEYIKYVDDTTTATISNDPLDDSLQKSADELIEWSVPNKMQVNVHKTKEMSIYFGKKYPKSAIPNLHINGSNIERVSSYKLLGVVFNDSLTWSDHVAYIISKASKRIFVLSQLTRSGVSNSDVVKVYCSIIRSVLEYCAPVWHPGLTRTQSDEIEKVQKRCLRIIFPHESYRSALSTCGLERLCDRREKLVRDLFSVIKHDTTHILNNLLIKKENHINRPTRNAYEYIVPAFKSARFKHSFFNYCVLNKF